MLGIPRDLKLNGLRLRLFGLLLRDIVAFRHTIKHHVATGKRVIGVIDGIVVHGRLRNARQKRGLNQRQLTCRFGEVALRSGLDAICALPVIDGVKIQQQDFVFREQAFHLERGIRFAHLALDGHIGHLISQNSVAHQLLSDSGRTRKSLPRKVAHHGAHNAYGINAAMRVEALVLHSNGALLNVIGNIIKRSERNTIFHLEAREKRGVIIRVHFRIVRAIEVLGSGAVGHVAQPIRA